MIIAHTGFRNEESLGLEECADSKWKGLFSFGTTGAKRVILTSHAQAFPGGLPPSWGGTIAIAVGVLMLIVGLTSIQSDYSFGVAMLVGCVVFILIGLMLFESVRKRISAAIRRSAGARGIASVCLGFQSLLIRSRLEDGSRFIGGFDL